MSHLLCISITNNNRFQEVPLSTLAGLTSTHPVTEVESKMAKVIDLAKTISLIFVGNANFRAEDFLYRGKLEESYLSDTFHVRAHCQFPSNLIISCSRRGMAEVCAAPLRRAGGEHARQLSQLAERRETPPTSPSRQIRTTIASVRATGSRHRRITAQVST